MPAEGRTRARSATWRRYLLFQLPGWGTAALLGWLLWSAGWAPGSWAAAAVALWVLKDFALYPLVRDAYRPAAFGPELLVGEEAVALTPIAESGWVRVRGERWRAQALGPPIPTGTSLRVVAARDNVLVVEPQAAAGLSPGPHSRDR